MKRHFHPLVSTQVSFQFCQMPLLFLPCVSWQPHSISGWLNLWHPFIFSLRRRTLSLPLQCACTERTPRHLIVLPLGYVFLGQAMLPKSSPGSLRAPYKVSLSLPPLAGFNSDLYNYQTVGFSLHKTLSNLEGLGTSDLCFNFSIETKQEGRSCNTEIRSKNPLIITSTLMGSSCLQWYRQSTCLPFPPHCVHSWWAYAAYPDLLIYSFTDEL